MRERKKASVETQIDLNAKVVEIPQTPTDRKDIDIVDKNYAE